MVRTEFNRSDLHVSLNSSKMALKEGAPAKWADKTAMGLEATLL